MRGGRREAEGKRKGGGCDYSRDGLKFIKIRCDYSWEGLKLVNKKVIIAERGEHLQNLLLTLRRVFD